MLHIALPLHEWVSTICGRPRNIDTRKHTTQNAEPGVLGSQHPSYHLLTSHVRAPSARRVGTRFAPCVRIRCSSRSQPLGDKRVRREMPGDSHRSQREEANRTVLAALRTVGAVSGSSCERGEGRTKKGTMMRVSFRSPALTGSLQPGGPYQSTNGSADAGTAGGSSVESGMFS